MNRLKPSFKGVKICPQETECLPWCSVVALIILGKQLLYFFFDNCYPFRPFLNLEEEAQASRTKEIHAYVYVGKVKASNHILKSVNINNQIT